MLLHRVFPYFRFNFAVVLGRRLSGIGDNTDRRGIIITLYVDRVPWFNLTINKGTDAFIGTLLDHQWFNHNIQWQLNLEKWRRRDAKTT